MNWLIILCLLLIGCAREEKKIEIPEERNCTTSRTEADDGVLVTCPDGTTAEVHDGATGAPGERGVAGGRGPAGASGPAGATGPAGRDGVDGADAIVEMVDPCGDGPGDDEVILRLSDGTAVAWMWDLGLVVLEVGQLYTTSDQQQCTFSVLAGGLVVDGGGE